MKSELK